MTTTTGTQANTTGLRLPSGTRLEVQPIEMHDLIGRLTYIDRHGDEVRIGLTRGVVDHLIVALEGLRNRR